MYHALKSLLKSKRIFIIATLQLSLGLSLLNYTINLVINSNEKSITLSTLFNPDTTYLVSSNISGELQLNTVPIILDTLDQLKHKGIIANIINYHTSTLMDIPSLEYALFNNTLEDHLLSDSYYCPFLRIDKTIFNRTDINVLEGRKMLESDFNKDYKNENIPMWLGIDHKGKVNIGDTFTTESRQSETSTNLVGANITFEIVGFLDYDELPTIHTQSHLIDKFTYSNRLILTPSVPNYIAYNEDAALTDFFLFIELTDNSYLSEFTNTFEKVCLDYGYTPNITMLKDAIDVSIGNLDRELFQTFILGFSLTFLSIVGIIAIFLGNITRRSNEFGIKLSQGASIYTLIKELVFEIFSSVFVSILFSLLILKFKGVTNLFSPLMVALNILFVLIIGFIITIPIIIRLKNLNIISLIRGK